jgi:hypothetical protein
LTNTKIITKLKKFSDLYDCAREAYGETLERLERNLEQYRGSVEIDGGMENASMVRNITYELIESEISPDIPCAKVEAEGYTEMSENLAFAAERLLYMARERLPLEEINDSDERSTYIFGGSILFLEWQRGERGDGDVNIRQLSPLDFVPEPGIGRIEDMSYCFLKFTTNKGELMSKYGVREDELSRAECGYQWGGSISLDDTVSLIIAFYKGDDGTVGRFIFSGDLVLADEEDYYGSLIDEKENFVYFENNSLQSEGNSTNSARVKQYKPCDFPIVLRKNISSEGELLGTSDADVLRPTQQAINKIESRIMQKLLRAAVTPIMPEDASVSLTNAIFGQVIKIKAGESASNYGTVDTTPDISQDIEEANRLYDQAKRLIGISDAYQGIDFNKVESGYAKSLRIKQAQSRLESKRRMKNVAYERLYKLIFQHYLAFCGGAKQLAYKDGYGQVRYQRFDKNDFIYTTENGVREYFDRLLFSVDTDLYAEYEREALWAKNLENLTSGTLGDKENPMTLLRYWQFQERAHYPNAKENVEYFKSIVEKERNNEDE